MKLSINLEGERNSKAVFKGKVPISIFSQPFTSSFTTPTDSFSDLSLALSTNFPSGPSLRLTYAPSNAHSLEFPFSLSLKSGLGLFGSHHNSPLVFSANFSLSNTAPNVIIPTFSLHFKPQLGHFSLHKKATPCSNPNPNNSTGSASASASVFGSGFAADGPLGWQEVSLEPFTSGKEKEGFINARIGVLSDKKLVSEDRKNGGLFSGVGVKTRTAFPLGRMLKVNLSWAVNFPGDLDLNVPYLTVNKISLERNYQVKKTEERSNHNNAGDLELLKGMFFWMRRDLEIMEKENRDMKQCLEYIKMGFSLRDNGVGTNVLPASSYKLEGFEQQRNKKTNGRNGHTELKNPANVSTDLESQLQKAIKAAAS